MMKTLYIKSGQRSLGTFETADIRILQTWGEVRIIDWRDLGRLFFEMRQCDLVYRWFADLPAWLASQAARCWRKPFVVVAGGFDTDCLSEIAYGIGGGGWCDRIFLARLRNNVLRRAAAVCCLSHHTLDRALALGARRPYILYPAVDSAVFHFGDRPPRRPCAVTAARLCRDNIVLKGLDTFIRAAAAVKRAVPEASFAIVGDEAGAREEITRLTRAAAADIEIHERGSDENFRRLLASSSIYVQASAIESFGIALAEAMACGCYPVVTRCGALPEVAGQIADFFDYGDATQLSAILIKLLRQPIAEKARDAIRRHIVVSFAPEIRRRGLATILQELGVIACGAGRGETCDGGNILASE